VYLAINHLEPEGIALQTHLAVLNEGSKAALYRSVTRITDLYREGLVLY
jgi:hypothetical protein